MDLKRSIDRKRESGGSIDIGTLKDGAIIEMKEIDGRLLVIKEDSIYEMIFADNIDPERTNFDLPPTIQKLIIDKGADSEIVGRTFLTAKTIFKTELISENIDCNSVLSLCIDLISELSLLEKEIMEYSREELQESLDYQKRKDEKGSFKLPSIVNLESKCKTIFQKADHIEQILIEIIIHFYPKSGLNKQSHFPKFHQLLLKIYGENDDFSLFVGRYLNFLRVSRELRNGLDHRLSFFKIIDFELKSDGDILYPTIELDHKGVELRRTNLIDFLNSTLQNFIEFIEMNFVFLASKSVKKSVLQYRIRPIPIEKRRYKYVKFSFWTPLGLEGFYSQ
jgi:hypothetical protein